MMKTRATQSFQSINSCLMDLFTQFTENIVFFTQWSPCEVSFSFIY